PLHATSAAFRGRNNRISFHRRLVTRFETLVGPYRSFPPVSPSGGEHSIPGARPGNLGFWAKNRGTSGSEGCLNPGNQCSQLVGVSVVFGRKLALRNIPRNIRSLHA